MDSQPRIDAEHGLPDRHLSEQDGHPLRVLVVEDYPDARVSLAILLELYGFSVQTVPDGRSALRLAETGLQDVILLDIQLPDMNGYEVVKRLRILPLARQPLIIAITGFGQDEDRRRSVEAGIDHFLLKPAEPEALRQLLNNHHQSRGSKVQFPSA